MSGPNRRAYQYHTPAGAPAFDHVRYPTGPTGKGKAFCYQPPGERAKGYKLPSEHKGLLYRLPELLAAVKEQVPRLAWTEGEHDADAMRDAGVPATSHHQGAEVGPYKEQAEWFRGYGGTVLVTVDNDAPGWRDASRRLTLLQGAAGIPQDRIKVLCTPANQGHPKYPWTAKDVAEYLEEMDGQVEGLESMEHGSLHMKARLADPADQGGYDASTWTPETVRSGASESDDWPEPEPLIPTLASPPLEVLPPFFRDYVKAVSDEKQVPADLVLLAALAVLSAATRGAWRVKPTAGWDEALSLYTLSLLPSGGRKSAVIKAVTAPLWHEQSRLRAEAQADRPKAETRYKLAKKRAEAAITAALKGDGEGLDEEAAALAAKAEELRPGAPPVLIIKDVTPEAMAIEMERQGGATAVFSAEGGFLANLGGRYAEGRPNLDLANEAYDGEPYVSRRVNRDDISIPRPFLALGLSIQPAMAAGLASRDMDGSGFLSRFAYAVPRNTVGTRTTGVKPVPAAVETAWEEAVSGVISKATALLGPRKPEGEYRQSISMSADAAATLETFRQDHEPRLDEETGDLAHVASWASKLPGFLVRIAALLTLAERSEAIEVSGPAMDAACALAPYLIDHASAAFAILRSKYEHTTGKHPVLAWLREAELVEFSHTDAFQALRKQAWASGSGGGERVRAALGELVEAGWLRSVEYARPPGRPGRPAERYVTHPKLHGAARSSVRSAF